MNEFERLIHQGKRRLAMIRDSFSQNKAGSDRPNIKMCPVCGRFVDAGSRSCDYCDSQLQAKPEPTVRLNATPVDSDQLNPAVMLFGVFAVFQFIAIVASSKLYDFEPSLFFNLHREALDLLGSNLGLKTVFYGEVWRLCTYMFLHGDFIHLFFNLGALAYLGPMTFQNFGMRRFWLITLLTGIGGGVLSLTGLFFYYHNSVGFSGALFGYLGANYIYASRDGGQWQLAKMLKNFMIWGNVLCIALTIFGIMAVDNFAHIGGMLTGLGLAHMFGSRNKLFFSPTWEKAVLGLCFGMWGFGIFRIVQQILGA